MLQRAGAVALLTHSYQVFYQVFISVPISVESLAIVAIRIAAKCPKSPQTEYCFIDNA
jgi:hypothetical protein